MVLQEVADALREYIFDQMPIRMLKVPEIKLIERREIYQHLLPSIENITEDILSEKAKEDWARYTVRSNLLVDVVKERAQYAILSHTWLDNEVTYEDWNLKRNLSGLGYDKLVQFLQSRCSGLWRLSGMDGYHMHRQTEYVRVR